MEVVKNINSIKSFFEAPISSMGTWLMDRLTSIVITIANVSYWWLLGAAMVGLFFYVAGHKKFSKYLSLPALIYLVLQILKAALV